MIRSFAVISYPSVIIDEEFDRLDTNADGVVDRSEFEKWKKNQEKKSGGRVPSRVELWEERLVSSLEEHARTRAERVETRTSLSRSRSRSRSASPGTQRTLENLEFLRGKRDKEDDAKTGPDKSIFFPPSWYGEIEKAGGRAFIEKYAEKYFTKEPLGLNSEEARESKEGVETLALLRDRREKTGEVQILSEAT